MLHWPTGANGKGALLTGDIITVVQDRRYVSFLRSYPNLIPLGASAIRRIVERIEPFSFEQIYGGWWQANVLADAKAAVARSAERYLRWINVRLIAGLARSLVQATGLWHSAACRCMLADYEQTGRAAAATTRWQRVLSR